MGEAARPGLTPAGRLSSAQLDAFARDGIVRLEGFLSAKNAARAREAVLARLGGGTDFKHARTRAARDPAVATLFDEDAVRQIVGQLFADRPLDRTLYPRPQLLLSPPDAEAWTIPSGWHTDSPRLDAGERPGVQLFAVLGALAPRGGGTLVVAGSHRLLADGRARTISEIGRELRRHDFFARLYAGQWDGAGLPEGIADDVPVRVVELSGSCGDVWLTDLRLLHAASPNAGTAPRITVTQRFVPADVLPAIAAAFGWLPIRPPARPPAAGPASGCP